MKVTFHSQPHMKAVFRKQDPMRADWSSHIEVPVTDYFDGDYEYTPSDDEQVLPVKGKTMREDIVVNRVPSSYGRIQWNGSYLRVY